ATSPAVCAAGERTAIYVPISFLATPAMASVSLRHQLVAPHLAASMWDAGAVAPCQCVRYFTHLKGEMTQPCVAAMATFAKNWRRACLISCSHWLPQGSLWVLVGGQGAMIRPGGCAYATYVQAILRRRRHQPRRPPPAKTIERAWHEDGRILRP